MAEYNFNIVESRSEISEIMKYKDFKKLIYNYQKLTRPITRTPLYKFRNRKIFLVILIILLLLWLLFSV